MVKLMNLKSLLECYKGIFADNIALLSDTASQAQQLLEYVEKAALRVGLHMNAKKTRFMTFNQRHEVQIKPRMGVIWKK